MCGRHRLCVLRSLWVLPFVRRYIDASYRLDYCTLLFVFNEHHVHACIELYCWRVPRAQAWRRDKCNRELTVIVVVEAVFVSDLQQQWTAVDWTAVQS